MSYRRSLLDHLIAYKHSDLGSPPAGVYKYQGRELRLHHILPVDELWLNIAPEYRNLVQAYVSRHGLELHRYFHHLNSSQAFALNLFVPFFESGQASSAALLRAMGQDCNLVWWRAEEIPEPSEGSNLDAVWDTDDGRRTVCEVKLSERGFGRARADQRRLRKLADIYAPVLRDHVSPELLEPSLFFEAYQICRNLWHVVGSRTGRLLVLMPRQNEKLWDRLNRIVDLICPSTARLISVVPVEDVLIELQEDPLCPAELREYAGGLQRKYVPGSGRNYPR